MSSTDNLLANTFDRDQARQNIGPDLDQMLTLWLYSWKMFFFLENPHFEKQISRQQKNYKHDKLLVWKIVNEFIEKQHILFHLAIEKY